MFYGREQEISYLKNIYETDLAEFITLYGRRRIGKTALLNHVFSDVEHIFFSARECTDYEQLRSLSEKILGKGKYFDTWDELFDHVAVLSEQRKTVLILDEFPYMVKGNPALPSLMQNLWDHRLKDTRIKLIICGSSMSFIEKEVLSEKNPLYGRMTGIYKMNELSFQEAKLFFPEYSEEQMVTAYAILGGVPHYLLQFRQDRTVSANICDSILNKGRVLYNEVDFLLKQEFREPQIYYTIIEKVAMGATKLNEIHTKTQISTNKLAVYLKNLIELGIIKKEYPVTERLKAKVNLHSGIYRLSTNFFEFWFRYVFPNLSELEEGLAEDVYEYEVAPTLNEFVSRAYEQICIELLIQKIRRERYPYRIKEIGRWWNKGDEIDIIGYHGSNFIAGECKWRKQKSGNQVLDDLVKKFEDNFNGSSVHYYLFSKSGFTSDVVRRAEKMDDVHLIEMTDV